MSKFVAGHVCKMNYHILNRNFALKLQGNCWEDYVLTFSSHLSVTIKRLHVTSRSKRSDSGERCEVKIAMKGRGGLGRGAGTPLSPSPLPRFYFFALPFSTAPYYLNAWNRLTCNKIQAKSSFGRDVGRQKYTNHTTLIAIK